MNIQRERIFDLSFGTQNATNPFLRKANEVEDSRNILWNEEIGSAVGRPGYVDMEQDFSSGIAPINAHTANFREGAVRMVAVNNAAGTFTLVRAQDPTTGVWTTLISDLPVNSQVFFKDYLNEVYISGYSPSGVPFQPRNINAALNVSTTRNLLNCPYPYYFVEYQGLMYAANVMIGATRYANRVYKSSPPTGAFTFIRGAQTGVLSTLAVDSVRYLKAGMAIDIYAKGTSTKLYDVTITSVDKTANTISFTPGAAASVTSANVNTTTDVLTTSSAHGFTTGQSIIFNAGTTAPTGVTTGSTYYVIVVSSTTIKLATTRANAIAGTAIDLTAQGSGTNTLTPSFVLADNDEVFLDGRYGSLTIGWNVDYPTEDRADYLEIQPGPASSDDITGVAKSSARLMIFTENTSTRWDGQNLVTFNTNVGCVSHRTIANIDDDWLIWMDKKARVWARNEGAGDQQFISRGVHNKLFSNFTAAMLRASAHAVVYNNKYKVCLGEYAGEEIRATYDFDSNTFTPETLSHGIGAMSVDEYNGDVRLYMYGDDGAVFIDEIGEDDAGTPITFMLQLGRRNGGTEGKKKWYGMFIYSQYAKGLNVMTSTKKQFETQGSIKDEEQLIKFPETMKESSMMNIRISGNYKGPAPLIEGLVLYFVVREDIPQNG